jgi:heat shock protein dnaJ domain protein
MIVTTNIRYKRLKDFSKQVLSILDVFVLKKYQGGNENGKNDWN